MNKTHAFPWEGTQVFHRSRSLDEGTWLPDNLSYIFHEDLLFSASLRLKRQKGSISHFAATSAGKAFEL